MHFALGSRAAQMGHRVAYYESLDSTNSEAMRLSRLGERGPLWIVAKEQSAGRGRRGRAWISWPGNLTASLLFAEAITPAVAATVGFAAGLAVAEVCRRLAPNVNVTLKWPNDVLANGGKVAGLLLESEDATYSVHSRTRVRASRGPSTGSSGNPESWVPAFAGTNGDSRSSAERLCELVIVVGFGINLAAAPVNLPFPAQSLRALGHPVSPEQAFAALTDAWTDIAGRWNKGHGFGDIRRMWLGQAEGLGQSISVRTGDRVLRGIFETLDGSGRIILRDADGTVRAISAGDVYFGGAGTVSAGAML